ncbi:MAG TPA: hypothetical protein VFN24_06400 [Microbacterium sp.]|nr:hypothetical protein [Microbacterium sp.]
MSLDFAPAEAAPRAASPVTAPAEPVRAPVTAEPAGTTADAEPAAPTAAWSIGDMPLLAQVAPGGAGAGTQASGKDPGATVDAAVRALDAEAVRLRAVAARAAGGDAAAKPPAGTAEGAPQTTPGAANGGLTAEKLAETLGDLEKTYESARTVLESDLPGDDARRDRLRTAYVAAGTAARAAAPSIPRVNLVIIADPGSKEEEAVGFIANATTYASIYYGTGQSGEVVETITRVSTVGALFDAIEGTRRDRLIGRIDIFAHGTIDPTHQMKLADSWHRVGAFEQEAKRRAGKAATLATRSRVDASTVIELHACRLGAPRGSTDTAQQPATTGSDFLTGFGTAVGGERGQTVTGYAQRWVPKVYQLTDLKGNPAAMPKPGDPRRRAFEKIALDVWKKAMAGGAEARALMTPQERTAGTVTDARAIEIMAAQYEQRGGWYIGFQYAMPKPTSSNRPEQDVRTAERTFTAENADWQSRLLTVTTPSTGATP